MLNPRRGAIQGARVQVKTTGDGDRGPPSRRAAPHADDCDAAARADDLGLRPDHRDQARLALAALCPRRRGGRDGGRLRRLVCGRRAVPQTVRPSDPAHRHRPRQQGPDRRRARPFHHQQFFDPEGVEREVRSRRCCRRVRPMDRGSGERQAFGAVPCSRAAENRQIASRSADRRILRQSGRTGN